MATKLVNGQRVPLTAQEETDLLSDQAAQTASLESDATANANLRNQFINILQSCVGVRGDQLTNIQVRALALYSAHKQLGCLDVSDFIVKPLNQWVR